MEYSELLPHLFAACSLIESQIKKLDGESEKINVPDILELQGVSSSLKKLSQTANLLQLSIAKNNVQESARLISIFYGLLYITRPSITRLIETYFGATPSSILVKSVDHAELTMH